MTAHEAQRRLTVEGAQFRQRQAVQGGGVVDWYWSQGRQMWIVAQYESGSVTLRLVPPECNC